MHALTDPPVDDVPVEPAAAEQPEHHVPRPASVDELRAAAAEGGAPQLALTVDDTGPRVVWANASALELLGLEPDDLVGRELKALGTITDGLPDWAVVVAQTVSGVGKAPADSWQSASVRVFDQSRAPVQIMVSEVGAGGWVAWLREVTDATRAAEDAARESEHRFRALAEHAPVGILVSEAGVRLGFVNRKLADITGTDIPNLLGTRWLDSIAPEDLPGLLETLDEVMAGASAERTVRVVSPAEAERWVQIRLSPVTTPRRAAGFIATVEDITTRRAWETQLAYQAGHDSLTGLSNRRRLIETLGLLMSSRRSRDREMAVLFCDLDGFKQINDTLGHDAGDRVLIEVGQRLAATAREYDMVARLAGDEFVVVLRDIQELAEAEAAAVRQLAALAPPIRVAGRTVRVSASIGVAMASEHDGAMRLLRAADGGMYAAKSAGRGQYRVFSHSGVESGGKGNES
jgi:diguanylate cyclase (GGDEF)-like protein/PAS domain S-box-containing protein